MRAVYGQMVRERTLETTFYANSVPDGDEFLAILQRTENLPVVAFDDRELAGLAWINAIKSDHAFAHYWFARGVWGRRSVEVAKEILDYWFRFDKDNDALFKVLLGETPANNRRAAAFNKRIGFTEVGTVPKVSGSGVTIFYLENPNGKEFWQQQERAESSSIGTGESGADSAGHAETLAETAGHR